MYKVNDYNVLRLAELVTQETEKLRLLTAHG